MKHRIDEYGNFQVCKVSDFGFESGILHLDGEDLDMYLMNGRDEVYVPAEMVEKMYQFIKDVKGEH